MRKCLAGGAVLLAALTACGDGGDGGSAEAEASPSAESPSARARATARATVKATATANAGLTVTETCLGIGEALPANPSPYGAEWELWLTEVRAVMKQASPEATVALAPTVKTSTPST